MQPQEATPIDQRKWVKGQWPDNICAGFITYEPSDHGGYMFRDASHGIPVLGHVTAKYHGSYPAQAREIARRLTACWNALAGKSIDEIEAMAKANAARSDTSTQPLAESAEIDYSTDAT